MKHITLTEDIIEKTMAAFRKQLYKSYANVDKMEISIPTKFTLPKEQRPSVTVTTLANAKMKKLIAMCDKEVAWHGTVRYEADINSYIIEDIFVFPQEVTAGTATATDDYAQWTMDLDDETFNHMRFHGHSHVNMGVFPSAVDSNYQQDLVDKINDFYIFAIYNKRGDYVIWIYDVANNVCYDKTDIDYDIELDEVTAWATTEVAAKVKERAPAVTTTLTTPVGSMASTDNTRQYINSTEWTQDGVHVYRTWQSGHTYSSIFGGYVENDELKEYEAFLKRAKEMVDEVKKEKTKTKDKDDKKNKRQDRRGQGAYDQYRKDKVKSIQEAKANKQMILNDNVCNGKCAICENPCAYQYS
jgi:hypothetical protein